jgi:hypothetical protein
MGMHWHKQVILFFKQFYDAHSANAAKSSVFALFDTAAAG